MLVAMAFAEPKVYEAQAAAYSATMNPGVGAVVSALRVAVSGGASLAEDIRDFDDESKKHRDTLELDVPTRNLIAHILPDEPPPLGGGEGRA